MNSNAAAKRLIWVDFLRGLAMLLVIWGHIDRTDHMFFVLTGPFKMPLFFAITGYLFRGRNGNVRLFAEKLIRTIVVPWIILSLVWLKVLYAVVRGKPELITVYLYRFFSGEDLWFIPCIIIAEIILFVIMKYARTASQRYMVMTIVGITGLILERYVDAAHFAMFDVACVAQLYLMFGYWFKNNEEKLRDVLDWKKITMLVVLYFVLILIACKAFPGMTMDVHIGKYYSYPLCFLLSFVSLLTLFLISPSIKKGCGWITFAGKNTLVFYICHYYVRRAFAFASGSMNIPLPDTMSTYICKFVIIYVTMAALSMVINRWMPFIVGKPKITKTGA